MSWAEQTPRPERDSTPVFCPVFQGSLVIEGTEVTLEMGGVWGEGEGLNPPHAP